MRCGNALQYCNTIYAACLFQVQGHAGLRALVLPGTMAESVVPNLLRIVPVLLQCRGDASLSMVSITFIELTRGGCAFKPDVIQAPQMHFDLSHTGAFPYFVFRVHYSPFHNELISVIFHFFFLFSSRNLFSHCESIRLQFGVSLNIKNDVSSKLLLESTNCDVLHSDLCVKITLHYFKFAIQLLELK